MKKAITVNALIVAGILMCSSQVMAQSTETVGKKSGMALSIEQLKDWIFSARSSSASRAKALPPPSNLPLPTDPAPACTTDPIGVIYGIPICESLPPPPGPSDPKDHQKPGTCRSCTNDP